MNSITEDTITPTLEAILASLGLDATTVPAGYLSAEEWAQQWGMCRKSALALLGQARTRGILLVERRRTARIDGIAAWTPCYAFRLPVN